MRPPPVDDFVETATHIAAWLVDTRRPAQTARCSMARSRMMDRSQKRAAPDIPAAPTMAEHECLAARAAWAERQGLLTIAAQLRQFRERAER